MTRLRCAELVGSYRFTQCTRQPVTQWVPGMRGHTEPDLQNLVCNFHAGAAKRRRYGQNVVESIPQADIDRLLPLQAAKDAEQDADRKAKDEAAQQRRLEQHAAAWTETEAEAQHSLVPDTESGYFDKEPTFTGKVWTDERQSGFDKNRLQVVPSERHYSAQGDLPWPYTIRMMSMSSMTPNEARALAALLVEAADKADELNADRY